MNKPFDKGLYAEYDQKAKTVAIKWLQTFGIEAVENPDQFGVDLLASNGRKFEVEVKTSWTGSEFPFQTVRVAGRKRDMFDATTWLIQLNNELSHCIVIDPYKLAVADHVTIDTKYSEQETFLEIPLSGFFIYPTNS